MRLTKMEKDKIFYEESGLITLQQGLVVEDLMLYGWGLTNDTSVKFTSSSGEFGANCKTNDSKLKDFLFWKFSLSVMIYNFVEEYSLRFIAFDFRDAHHWT